MSKLPLLQDTVLFVEVARQKSFKKASELLGVPTATLSRRIAALEKDLNLKLFNRTTRSVQLTSTGKEYFEQCEHLVHELLHAQENLLSRKTVPKGQLNITMPVDLGIYVVGPLLPEFSSLYPDIDLNIDLSAKNINFYEEPYDIGIRIGEIEDESLISKRLGRISMQLYASKGYLNNKGRPDTPDQLKDHSCLLINKASVSQSWTLICENETKTVSVKGQFIVNNLGLLRELAMNDLGIVALPRILVDGTGKLEHVLPKWRFPELTINSVMSSRLQPAHARVFLEYFEEKMNIL